MFSERWRQHCDDFVNANADKNVDNATSPSVIHSFGRTVTFDRHCDGAINVQFHTLCGDRRNGGRDAASPLGPQDFLKLARKFHTVFLEGVPKFSLATRNEVESNTL